MIKNLHSAGSQWFWKNSTNSYGTYYTNGNGDGIFYQSDRTGETKQIIGTCQFSACKTASGMRRKLNKLFDWQTADPAI